MGGEVPEEKALALATASEQSEVSTYHLSTSIRCMLTQSIQALPETQPDMLRNSLDGLTALGSYYQPSRRSESVGTCDNDLSDTACTIMESPTPNNQPEVDRANSTALVSLMKGQLSL